MLVDFDPEALRLQRGRITGLVRTARTWRVARVISMKLPLAPIRLPAGEVVETTMYLDGIKLPRGNVDALVGKTFTFPVNPARGYIDASIYLESAHNQIDVTSIGILSRPGDLLVVRLRGVVRFERERTSFRDLKLNAQAEVQLG